MKENMMLQLQKRGEREINWEGNLIHFIFANSNSCVCKFFQNVKNCNLQMGSDVADWWKQFDSFVLCPRFSINRGKFWVKNIIYELHEWKSVLRQNLLWKNVNHWKL